MRKWMGKSVNVSLANYVDYLNVTDLQVKSHSLCVCTNQLASWKKVSFYVQRSESCWQSLTRTQYDLPAVKSAVVILPGLQ